MSAVAMRQAQDMSNTTALPVGEVVLPEGVDLRGKRGKKYAAEKARLAIELRQQGYTLQAIAQALGSSSATLSMYIWKYDPRLLHAAPTQRYNAETAQAAVDLVAAERARRQATHRARVDEFRKQRRRGRRLPCHVERPEVQRSAECEQQLAALVAQQERELDRAYLGWGERPSRSPSVGGTRSFDERLEARAPDRQDGKGSELHDIVGDKAARSPEDIYIEREFHAELIAALGDDEALARLADSVNPYPSPPSNDAPSTGPSPPLIRTQKTKE